MRILKSLAATALLIALLVGIPVALVITAGNPLPSWDRLSTLATVPDYAGAFLLGTVLPMVGWLAWASFAWAVLSELPSAVHGVRGAPRPGLQPQQTLAAVLLATIFAGFLSTPTPAVAAGPATQKPSSAASVFTPLQATGEDTTPVLNTQEHPTAAVQLPSVTVTAGDGLWSLAEKHLGDGTRYPQIYDLNAGVPQADGTTLGPDRWLTPGWILTLPADATLDPPVPGRTVDVQPGDTLSQIALEELGHAQAYPQLVETTRRTVQPDGQRLIDPDVIEPGWQITVPSDADTPAPAPPVEEPSGEQQGQTPQDQPTPAPPPTTPTGPSTAAQQPAHEHPAPTPERLFPQSPPSSTAAAGHPPATGREGLGGPTPTGSAQHPTTHPDEAEHLADHPPIRTVGGVGALLASALLALIGARRLIQRRTRRPGQHIAMPTGAAVRTEQQLREVADQDSAEDVDRALRFLCVWAQDHATALPEPFCARVRGDQLTLYLAAAAELPSPFETEDPDRMVWVVAPSQIPQLKRTPTSPWPSLVTVGQDAHGGHVLLDLEFLGALHVTGDEQLIPQALAALAVELAANSWSENLTVTLVGVAGGLAEVVGTGRLRAVEDVDELLVQLMGKAADTEAALKAADAQTLGQARAAGLHAQGWDPEIVLIDRPLTAHQRIELDRLTSVIPRLGVAAVGTSTAQGQWSLQIVDQEEAMVSPLGLRITPQLLTDRDKARIIEVLATTTAPPHQQTEKNVQAHLRPVSPHTVEATETPPEDKAPEPEETGAAPAATTPADQSAEAGPTPGTENTSPSPDQSPRAEPAAPEAVKTGEGAAEPAAAQRPVVPQAHPSQQPEPPSEVPIPVLEAIAQARGEATDGHRPPLVCLLGPLVLRDGHGRLPMVNGKPSASTAARCTAMAAFLALSPGASTEQLHAAFWPNDDPAGPKAGTSRNKLSTQTRNLLGYDSEGTPYFPQFRPDTGYRLHETVRTDWQVFCDLIAQGIPGTSTPRLVAALKLVRGAPFQGVKERNVTWAETLRQQMIATISDVAHEVCRRSLLTDQVSQARLAATIGRTCDPVNEALWRDAMRAEAAAGSTTGLERVIDQLHTYLTGFEEDYEPEEETEALITSLRSRTRRMVS